MRENRVLPFYMTYPMPMMYEDEDVMMRDLEYLQQMYPQDAKKYQKKIVSILDKMDYEGSMIYDDYPDQFMLYKLSRDITEMIRQDEIAQTVKTAGNSTGGEPGRAEDIAMEDAVSDGQKDVLDTENPSFVKVQYAQDSVKTQAAEQSVDLSPERWKQIQDLVQVLLFYEIYKRRHNSGRGMLKYF